MAFSIVFFKYGNLVAYALGFAGNLAIIALIVSQDDQYIKKYTAFLLQTTVLEAILNFASLCILPISGKRFSLFYAFSGNHIINLQSLGLLIAMTIYFSIIILAVGSTFVPFYIRYLIICRKRVIQSRHYFWIYCGFVMCFALIFFIIFFIIQYGTTLNGNFTRVIGTKAIFTGTLFVTLFSLTVLTLTGISSVIIYRLHVQILKQLASKNVFMHIKIKTLSKSLQDTLFVQNLCLLIGAVMTSFVLLVSSFIECESCTSYGFIFVTWAPLSNPICFFIMAKTFREKLGKMFETLCFKKTTQVSAFSVNTNYLN